MSQRRLQQHQDQFEQRNLFLFALLGLVSCGRMTRRLIDDITDGPATAPSSEASHSVHLLLGLMSLWRRVETELLDWAPEGERTTHHPAPYSETRVRPRSLLR